ncbi:universal stress protein [Boseongicola aestuarii]|uniref:Universal stress protein family protein n=1 Tax=Boseongicola aestuarii TaxID=1470561 RepID=A0A238IUK7_9RHOB|nr:universal stress protein [Boseongicola aestuarii]SMX21956.1 Universal stress protein family protein [Boseongicola aestuarii]
MAMKTLLACLMNRENADAVLAAAVPLARAHQAHLIGLHTIEALLVYPGIAIHVPDSTFRNFNESQAKEAKAIEAIFKKHTANEDFPCEWRLVKAESSTAATRMIESAHGADVVIMPKEENTFARADQNHAQERVIRESGRPVIIVPNDYDGPELGHNILLGWSDTREAARAAHDALLVAQDGCNINILRGTSRKTDELADFGAIEIAAMFGRHGFSAQTAIKERGSADVAEVLMKQAFEQGADMIVTGAFGHNRVYDFVIGAVTQSLLEDSQLPVLFSA